MSDMIVKEFNMVSVTRLGASNLSFVRFYGFEYQSSDPTL